MKTTKTLFVICFLAATSFIACKKDKDEPSLTAQEKMLINTWKLESLSMPKSTNPETDSSILTDCIKEATFVFNAQKGFQFVDAGKDCDSTILPYDKGNWVLSNEGKELTLKGKRTIKWNIKKLEENQIKATFRDSTSVDHNYIKTITLKK